MSIDYFANGRFSTTIMLSTKRPFPNQHSQTAVAHNETFDYTLTYYAGDSAHSVTITDTVPNGTTALSASGSKSPNPIVNGQEVSWTVSVDSSEMVTLTIEAQGVVVGLVENTAVFAGQETLQASTQVFVYTHQVYLPIIKR